MFRKGQFLFILISIGILICFGKSTNERVLNLRDLPGIDFVGFGYDIRFEDPDEALTKPILEWTYSAGKSYYYPPKPDVEFKVPDEVHVRTLSYTEATSAYYDSVKEWKKTTQLKVGIDANALSEGDDVITPPNTRECSISPPPTNETIDGEDPCEARKRSPELNADLVELQNQGYNDVTYVSGE